MSHKIKRVPMDFNWPQGQVWKGYRNPYEQERVPCMACEGTGSTATARLLQAQWSGHGMFRPEDRGSVPFSASSPAILVAAAHRVVSEPDRYGAGPEAIQREAARLCVMVNRAWQHHLNELDVSALLDGGCLPEIAAGGRRPTPAEVNAWSLTGDGHDRASALIVIAAECTRVGLTVACPSCKGEATIWLSLAAKRSAADWRPHEPPTGEGWQLWEMISEGSPASPVFASEEDLSSWMAAPAREAGVLSRLATVSGRVSQEGRTRSP